MTTDLKLTYNKAIGIYNIRWSIEVFFKEAKQYLNLGKNSANDFGAQIADVTISMAQYIVLAFYKRFLSYETTGVLFRESQKQLIELTIERRLWALFVELQLHIVELFEIDIDTLYKKMLSSSKYEKMMVALVQSMRDQANQEAVNNAA